MGERRRKSVEDKMRPECVVMFEAIKEDLAEIKVAVTGPSSVWTTLARHGTALRIIAGAITVSVPVIVTIVIVLLKTR